MKEHTFDPSDPISILGFLTTFKLACDANRIHEGAAMWAMLSFVADLAAASPNSRMVKSDGTTIAVATVRATTAP